MEVIDFYMVAEDKAFVCYYDPETGTIFEETLDW